MSIAVSERLPNRLQERFRGLYGIAGPSSGSPARRQAETMALAEALLGAGVRVLQLRDKESDGRSLLVTARGLRRLTEEAGAAFIVNDRLDIALLADADGVHVGQDDLPVEDVRRVTAHIGRAGFIVGLSTHDLDQVRAARSLDVDYIGFGPVFGTATKKDALPPRGVPLLAEAVRLAGALPVVAIGGIGLSKIAGIREAGAPMAAVIGEIVNAAEPQVQAHAIHSALS